MNQLKNPLLLTSVLAAVGGALVPAVTLRTLWQLSPPYGALFTVLVLTELGAVVVAVVRPHRARLAAVAAGVMLTTWVVDRLLGWLPDPDPWLPTDTVLGITDHVGAALQAIAVLGFVLMNTNLRIVSWIALLPVLVIAAVAVLTAGAGAGLPARLSTVHNGTNVEYCRPDGVPLPMDIYTPAQPRSSAPVAVYVHGGGFMLGDQESDGLGASLANSPGALFAPLRDRLTASGFVVASVGYRLAPASPWPGPITDVKCAIRFLRAHATELDINPKRIGVWGSSAGGTLVSLLGTTDTSAGFDVGEYTDQTSEVQAVVDMFGAADLTDHITGFAGTTIHIALNNDVLRAASPSTYLRAGMPRSSSCTAPTTQWSSSPSTSPPNWTTSAPQSRTSRSRAPVTASTPPTSAPPRTNSPPRSSTSSPGR
ncbi:alpha/beta hydrolase [Kibdelosporangium lantanae]